jgi:sugar lactone lactonase YvrE
MSQRVVVRIVCGLIAGVILGLPAPRAGADPLPPWRQRFLAIATGCRATDPATCRDSLAVLRTIVPGHPGVLLAYARAANRSGAREQAMDAMRDYAAMGLSYDLNADTTFSALRTFADYDSVAARLSDNARPVARAESVHRFSDPEFLVEDVVWDEAGKRWLVSTIRARKILAVDGAGNESDFAAPDAEQKWGIFGLALDAKNGLLWAGTAATREVPDAPAAEYGKAGLVAYELATGKVARRVPLAPADTLEHVLGDLTVAKDGTVYVTDSLGGGVYRLAPGAKALEALVTPRAFFSPQAPALSGDGKELFVADYGRGIAKVDLKSRAVTWLAQPDDVATAGTDGLYWRDGDLVAVQNGVAPHRVVVFELSGKRDRIEKMRVLESASLLLGEPNHGAIVGDAFTFIANSGWDRMETDGVMNTTNAKPAELRRVALK